MEDNILIKEVEFNQEFFEKNIQQNEFNEEYEAGDLDGDN